MPRARSLACRAAFCHPQVLFTTGRSRIALSFSDRSVVVVGDPLEHISQRD